MVTPCETASAPSMKPSTRIVGFVAPQKSALFSASWPCSLVRNSHSSWCTSIRKLSTRATGLVGSRGSSRASIHFAVGMPRPARSPVGM